jgi:hypothetical protein
MSSRRTRGQLRLNQLAGRTLRWEDIYTTRDRARLRNRNWDHRDALTRAHREGLFELRMEAHLMVAVAAACCGLQAFAERPSALVRTMALPPTVEQLAPFWLRHVLGECDYAGECERLLTNLADRYDVGLSPSHSGLPTPGLTQPRTEAELGIGNAVSPLTGRHQREVFDGRRWQGLFETTLEDQSIQQWYERLSQADIT